MIHWEAGLKFHVLGGTFVMVWGDLGISFLYGTPQLPFLLIWSVSPKKPSLIFWLPAFGVPSSGENGWWFHSPLYKKKLIFLFFCFFVVFFLNSNDNISSIIQMRKLLKSLKFLYWVSWQLPFILWSETDNFSWFVLCHHNGHFYREITSFNLLLSWLTWPIFSPQTGP